MTNNEKSPDRYALVGHPVEHSRSPLIHTVFARQTGQRLTYELIDAEPASFETAVRGFGAAGGKGLNITVPHKQAAFALCKTLSEAAKVAGAVNTISIVAGGFSGHNTDGIGLIRDVTMNLRQVLAGKRIAVLGAGGAARGIIGPLLNEKPVELTIANRAKERAEEVAAHFGNATLVPRGFEELGLLRPFDVVINATSAGLKGESSLPFPPLVVGPRSFCYDLVYGSTDTPFVAWAKTHGAARAVHGWGMLVEQAAESFAIWRGVRPDTKPLLKQAPR
ncbi:MAG TPA: shikimate dehydrogenase [Gammaproteobacteria bacterium]|nr:shikimate dehydrogenase [Gammaproteobacteria bacterium]